VALFSSGGCNPSTDIDTRFLQIDEILNKVITPSDLGSDNNRFHYLIILQHNSNGVLIFTWFSDEVLLDVSVRLADSMLEQVVELLKLVVAAVPVALEDEVLVGGLSRPHRLKGQTRGCLLIQFGGALLVALLFSA
jgi:hypothetical protein